MNRNLGYFPLVLGIALLAASLSAIPGQESLGRTLWFCTLAAVGMLFAWTGFNVVTGGVQRQERARELAALLRALPEDVVARAASELARTTPVQIGPLVKSIAASRFAELPREAGFVCDACGREGTTRNADYTEVKGRIIYMESRSIRGRLCGGCSRTLFHEMTVTTATQGWFGLKSLLLTLVALPVNVVSRIRAPAPLDSDAAPPRLDCDLLRQMAPIAGVLAQRLGQGMGLSSLASATAEQAEATPGQVVLYVAALTQQIESDTKRSAKGPKPG